MKTYFMIETSQLDFYTRGKTFQSLEKLLDDIGVKWEEEDGDGKFDLETPNIIINSTPSDKDIKIFRLTDKLGYQEMIAEFNFYRDCLDDVQDFISEFYREIITSTNELLNIKKFNDFN